MAWYAPDSPQAELYRELATQLDEIFNDRDMSVVLNTLCNYLAEGLKQTSSAKEIIDHFLQ